MLLKFQSSTFPYEPDRFYFDNLCSPVSVRTDSNEIE